MKRWEPQLYLQIRGPDVVARGNALLNEPRIETFYLAPKPPPPHGHPARNTRFSADQYYVEPGPSGFGFDAISDGLAHPVSTTIADIEYGFDPTHEELSELLILGWDTP